MEPRRICSEVRLHRPQRARGTTQPASRLRNSGLSSKETPASFKSAFDNAPIGMALIDLNGSWLQVNDALCRITGYSDCELRATTLQSLIHPDDFELDRPFLHRLLAGQIPSYQIEKRYHHLMGHFFWVQETVSLVRDRQGHALYLITQMQDISERKKLTRHLEFLVDHDLLTGLFNRRYFEQALAHELERAARYGAPGAVLLIDLDNFKEVNDRLGHTAGDSLLKGIGGLLKHRLRLTDTFARVGGDEFAILLPHVGAEQALVVADEFVKSLGRQTAVLANQSISITASVGVALFNGFGPKDVLAYADMAMYEAKRAGRNRFVLFQPSQSDEKAPESSCYKEVERIRRAIQEEQFILFWQPIIELGTMKISQYEILLRIPGCGDREPLLPSSFLYVAERFGLIMAIDSWVVRQAIALIAAHSRAERNLVLHVNLSAKSIWDPKFVEIVEESLVEGKIDPACLVLEITETAAIANLERARAFTNRLHNRGCQLALDDFGAGFTSFFYLKNFPFDYLKIDGEFIRGLSANPVDRLVVQAIAGIARGMRKRTIAEFVGDSDTAKLLLESGIDYAQGYHVGPPQPVMEVNSLRCSDGFLSI
jgi:diguanylate cyclase (GGDEF)-like protein/PAS domain S-box-containing protein